MKDLWKKGILFCLSFCISTLAVTCTKKESALERIKASGEIRVLTRNNAHCYYEYRDRTMGFEYDLAKAFSEYLGVELKIVLTKWGDLFKELQGGGGDFIAASLTITPSRKALADFSKAYLKVQQHIIFHKHERDIEGLEDLKGKTVHVRTGTSYEDRLMQLKKEGLDLSIETYEDMPTEALIEMVAKGEIECTVADTNIALLNRRYHPDVVIAFPIEKSQSIGWAVRKGEPSLKQAIDRFFEKIRASGQFSNLHEKYYANVEIFDYLDLKIYHRRLEKRLPRYESTIRRVAKKHGFDWRLIAAMIYQESHFDPMARSYTGVRGMMQLTQVTAEALGVQDRLDPEESIKAGVKYLKKLYNRYEEAKNPDRTLMALAAYNVGHGHIMDARNLAEQKGLNPDSWSALEVILPLLRYPLYFKQTKHGYCRGTEPVRYVNRILTYYDILKRKAIL